MEINTRWFRLTVLQDFPCAFIYFQLMVYKRHGYWWPVKWTVRWARDHELRI